MFAPVPLLVIDVSVDSVAGVPVLAFPLINPLRGDIDQSGDSIDTQVERSFRCYVDALSRGGCA
jgi:hypothetical protein